MKKLIYVLLVLGCGSVQGATVIWDFDATVEATSSDPLGIDGESVFITLFFDDTETWTAIEPQPGAGFFLYLPSYSSSVSMTGSHTVALVETMPAAFVENGETNGAMVEQVGSDSYMDLVIDGNVTRSINFFGDISVTPLAGNSLLPEHLMSNLIGNASIDFPVGLPADEYAFSGVSIGISVVPIPAAAWLFGSGLALLGWFRGKG